MHLIYNEKIKAQEDLDKIYATMLQETACFHSGYMLNVKTNTEEFILDKSETELNSHEYPLFGFTLNEINTSNGYTTAWDRITELNDGRFAITKNEKYNITYSNSEELEDISMFFNDSLEV